MECTVMLTLPATLLCAGAAIGAGMVRAAPAVAAPGAAGAGPAAAAAAGGQDIILELAAALCNPAAVAAGLTSPLFAEFGALFSDMTQSRRHDKAALLRYLLYRQQYDTVVAVMAAECRHG